MAEVTFFLQESSKKLFKWFEDKHRKNFGDKCHLIANPNAEIQIQLKAAVVKNS